jgi:outer membrane protein assembly factor BamB
LNWGVAESRVAPSKETSVTNFHRGLCAVAVLPACSLYFHDAGTPDAAQDSGSAPDSTAAVTYDLTTIRAIAGEHRIAGVDSDQAGGVWIAYKEFSSAELTITHLDASHTKLSEWTLMENGAEVSGLAFSGDGVWVNDNAIGSEGTNRVSKLDPMNGTTLVTFETPGQIADLEMLGDQLLLSSIQNEMIALDPTTGGMVWRTATPGFFQSTQTGIAAYHGNVFVSSWDADMLMLMDTDGHILGTAMSPLIYPRGTSAAGLFLARDGDDGMILATESQITWLAVSVR